MIYKMYGNQKGSHMFYIYGLIDPQTKELRYIGYANNMNKRLKQHIHKARSNNKLHKKLTYKEAWIVGLDRQDLEPQIIQIEMRHELDEAKQTEIDMIAYFKFIGCNLTNATIGGDGIPRGHKFGPMPEETKKKISEAHKGVPYNGIVWNKGIPRTIEDCLKISKSKMKLTNEQVLAIQNDSRTLVEIAKDYNVHFNTISRIKRKVLRYT